MTHETPPLSPVKSKWPSPWLFIAIAALALAGWQWLETRNQLAEMQQEVSRRLLNADTARQEEQSDIKQLREQFDALRGQATALQTQQQELLGGREESILLEVEQAITLAAQQLQIAGNLPAARLALQTADARLARLERPQLIPLRKAIAHDLERLNTLPFVDLAGISLRLEQALQVIDKLPLASHGRPPAKTEITPSPESAGWAGLAERLWQGFSGLIRIQRFDRDEAVLLAPGQSFFLRENIKLRLLNARLALFAHEPSTFQNELKIADDWLAHHFDSTNKEVLNLQSSLRQLATANLSSELPGLNESQSALRQLRSNKEKR